MNRSAMLLHALRRRCPWCGGGNIFQSWFELAPHCPTCGYRFEREEGYTVGAMIVIMGLIEIAFGVLLVLGIALTYPDVPWTGLLVVGLTLMIVVPLVGYPLAKLLWIAIDLLVHHQPGQIPDGAFTKEADAETHGV